MNHINETLCLGNAISRLARTVSLLVFILSCCHLQAGNLTISPVVEANLRHDIFGRDFINLYGTAQLCANLNPVNDDRAVLEFPMDGIPKNSVITSARLTVFVGLGGGTAGSTGSFVWYGYTGDGRVSMNDYYQQQLALNHFNEGVPPAFGLTSFDVTAFAADQYTAGTAYDGFLLQALSQNVEVGFEGPENSIYPQPKLQVVFEPVPEPTAVLLVGVGAVALVWRRPGQAERRPGLEI